MFFMKKAVLLRVAVPLAALAVISLSSCPAPVSPPSALVDLTPGAMAFTGSAIADGTNLDVTLPIQNLQPGAVSAAFDVDFYLALTSAFSPSTDTKLATVAHSSGVPGSSSVTLGASLLIPDTLNVNQVVYIYAVVDAGGAVTETDETNNMSTAATAAAVPVYDDEALLVDLTPGAMAFTGTAVADGTTLDVSLPIQNLQSTAVSAAFDVDFYLAFTSAFSPSTDTKLATVAHSSGVPGSSSVTLGASLLIPDTLNVNQVVYIYAVVDAGGAVTETDETNNMSTAATATPVLVYDDDNASRTYPVILETYSPSGSSMADTVMGLYRDDAGSATVLQVDTDTSVPYYSLIDRTASPLAPGTYYAVVTNWLPDVGPYAMAVKTAGIDNVAFADLALNTEDTYETDDTPQVWPVSLNTTAPVNPVPMKVGTMVNRYSGASDWDWFKFVLP
jgi:hypothetical protein